MPAAFLPPIFFSILPKRKRAVDGPKEKNAWRGTCAFAQVRLKYGGCSSGLPPILQSPTGALFSFLESAFPAFTLRRSSLVVIVKPALLAPLTLPWSASGKRSRGCPGDPNPRTIHAAPDFSCESVSPAFALRRSSLVVIVKPALLAPLTLPWSASGKRSRGCPGNPNPR